ncbi:MAG: hypothetical protein LBP59_09885 [Planctomycetaceae bacterium]|nr:hypothetical protein [Planctomycetaceae bacterium]
MSTTACRRDARDPSDDLLLQKLPRYTATPLTLHPNFRERLCFFYILFLCVSQILAKSW